MIVRPFLWTITSWSYLTSVASAFALNKYCVMWSVEPPTLRPFRSPPGNSHFSTLHSSLISRDDTWGNYAVLSGTAAASHLMAKHTRIGKLLGPPVSAMALTFLSASIGLLPAGGSPASRTLQTISLQLATPLVLLGANLRNVRCGPLLLSFGLAASSTALAAGVGWNLVGTTLTSALGKDGVVVAAALLAKNIGGGINYMSVCQSLQASPVAVAAGLCVDNLFALVYFPISSALANSLPDVADETGREEFTASDEPLDLGSQTGDIKKTEISVQSISTVLWLACVFLWLGERLGGTHGVLPLCSLLTVLVASRAPSTWIRALQPTAECLGLSALYLFFSTAGAPGMAVATSVRNSILPLGLFLTCLYSIHGGILALTSILGRTRDIHCLKPQRLLVASSASIGGPATAVALAETASWQSLVVPSMVVGNIGYAIGTFCGLFFAHWA